MDAWEGSRDTLESSKIHNKSKLPESITVTIFAKFCESMKVAKLDINESTLVFEVPDLYYLDLNLKYQVNSEAGSAKFDKTKKTLTIRVPVTGLTEDSQKVLEEHYREYKEKEQERIKSMEQLQESKLEEQMEARRVRKKVDQDENENEEAGLQDQENDGGNSQNKAP